MSAIRHRTRTLERGVEWLPRHDAHYILARMMVSSRQATPICIVQDTLREVEEVIHRATVFSFGLLTGSLCHCRRSERDYTLIDGWQECEYPAGEGDVYGQIALTLREQTVLLERTGTTVIGFFLSGTSVIPRAAREDVALFRAVFEHPWNVMLLRDRAPDGEVGAFMRVESMDEQPYAAPFTELLPAVVRGHQDDVPATVVKWTNYQPTEVVRQFRPGESPARHAHAGVSWHRELLNRTVVKARMAGGSAVSEVAAAVSRLRAGAGEAATTPPAARALEPGESQTAAGPATYSELPGAITSAAALVPPAQLTGSENVRPASKSAPALPPAAAMQAVEAVVLPVVEVSAANDLPLSPAEAPAVNDPPLSATEAPAVEHSPLPSAPAPAPSGEAVSLTVERSSAPRQEVAQVVNSSPPDSTDSPDALATQRRMFELPPPNDQGALAGVSDSREGNLRGEASAGGVPDEDRFDSRTVAGGTIQERHVSVGVQSDGKLASDQFRVLMMPPQDSQDDGERISVSGRAALAAVAVVVVIFGVLRFLGAT